MRRLFYIINIFILGGVLLTGCQGDGRFKERLDVLDTFLVSNPDSAYRELLELETTAQQQPERLRMYYELLRADAQNKAYIDFTTDSVMLLVTDYYDRHGSANEQLRAHYLLGCTYRDLGDAPRALEAYLNAASKADTLATDCDNHTLMVVHSQMAHIYELQYLCEQEWEETKLAEQFAWKDNDTINAMFFQEMYPRILMEKGDYGEATILCEDLYNRYLHLGQLEKAGLSCGVLVNVYLLQKDYNSAKQWLEVYKRSILKKEIADNVDSGEGAYWVFMGETYLGLNMLDSAEYSFRKAIEIDYSPNAPTIFSGMERIYYLKQEKDSVLKYSQLFHYAKNNEYDMFKTEASIKSKHLYNYLAERNIAEVQRKKAARNQNIIILLTVSFIVLTLITVHIKYRHDKKRELKTKELKIQHEETINTLRLAEDQLLSLKLNNACNEEKIANKTIEIEELKNKINLYEKQLSAISNKVQGMELHETYIYKHFIQYLTTSTIKHINEDNWKSLEETIEKLYPKFLITVNPSNSLSEREFRICLLVKCGFKPKEIDSILSLPNNTASTLRQRLLVKIFKTSGRASDFDKFVTNIQ